GGLADPLPLQQLLLAGEGAVGFAPGDDGLGLGGPNTHQTRGNLRRRGGIDVDGGGLLGGGSGFRGLSRGFGEGRALDHAGQQNGAEGKGFDNGSEDVHCGSPCAWALCLKVTWDSSPRLNAPRFPPGWQAGHPGDSRPGSPGGRSPDGYSRRPAPRPASWSSSGRPRLPPRGECPGSPGGNPRQTAAPACRPRGPNRQPRRGRCPAPGRRGAAPDPRGLPP